MMVMVTRFAGHKGLDLLCYIARRLLWEDNVQLVVVGTGEAQYENFFRDLQRQFPSRYPPRSPLMWLWLPGSMGQATSI